MSSYSSLQLGKVIHLGTPVGPELGVTSLKIWSHQRGEGFLPGPGSCPGHFLLADGGQKTSRPLKCAGSSTMAGKTGPPTEPSEKTAGKGGREEKRGTGKKP